MLNLRFYVYVKKLPYLKFGFGWRYFFGSLDHPWTQPKSQPTSKLFNALILCLTSSYSHELLNFLAKSKWKNPIARCIKCYQVWSHNIHMSVVYVPNATHIMHKQKNVYFYMLSFHDECVFWMTLLVHPYKACDFFHIN
jgi:hypothetical protein